MGYWQFYYEDFQAKFPSKLLIVSLSAKTKIESIEYYLKKVIRLTVFC